MWPFRRQPVDERVEELQTELESLRYQLRMAYAREAHQKAEIERLQRKVERYRYAADKYVEARALAIRQREEKRGSTLPRVPDDLLVMDEETGRMVPLVDEVAQAEEAALEDRIRNEMGLEDDD